MDKNKSSELYTDFNKITDNDMNNINKYTMGPLKKEDVYVFSLILCDNEIDRDREVFPVESLNVLQEMFIGKTGVKDHNAKADNQNFRIFDTYLNVIPGKYVSETKEAYTQLIAKAYTLNTPENKEHIDKIKGGILKEVSIGCSVSRIECSVCGANLRGSRCEHEGEKETIYKLLEPTDAYEWSFVAVPSQRMAGVIKKHNYKGEPVIYKQQMVEEDFSEEEYKYRKKIYDEAKSELEQNKK